MCTLVQKKTNTKLTHQMSQKICIANLKTVKHCDNWNVSPKPQMSHALNNTDAIKKVNRKLKDKNN